MGDAFLVSDANMMRGQWRIGLVIKYIPSSDGHVRREMLRPDNRGSGAGGTQHNCISSG